MLSPDTDPFAILVAVAGTRWAIEETFQTGKTEVGPDHYQVRRYDGWYRHMTLAMFAHAFLTVTRATSAGIGGARTRPEPHPLTVPEVRRLLSTLIWNRPATPNATLNWSVWQRRHQAPHAISTTPPAAPHHKCGCCTRRGTLSVCKG